MNIEKVLIEFLVIFIIVYLFYYFFAIKKYKNDKSVVPVEVSLILLTYRIDAKKIDLYQMIKVVSLVTTTIISVIITIINEFFNNTIVISLIFGTLISVLVAIILYRIIGKHYEKISHK